MLECVVNISEGRDGGVVAAIAATAGTALLDVHSDRDHHRSVLTLAGPDVERAARAVARRTLESVDLEGHDGVHPRLGVLDVVPFVPLGPDGGARPGLDLGPAVAARDRFAEWAGAELGVPCFLYGPERSLPDVRRRAFVDLRPDAGPDRPHPRAGACAVGARPVMVAYNLWLTTADQTVATSIAAAIRGEEVRALSFVCGGTAQVSCNLVDPFRFGPAEAYDAVAHLAAAHGVAVARAELVGLAPMHVVEAVPAARRSELDLDPDRTVEARVAVAGSRHGP